MPAAAGAAVRAGRQGAVQVHQRAQGCHAVLGMVRAGDVHVQRPHAGGAGQHGPVAAGVFVLPTLQHVQVMGGVIVVAAPEALAGLAHGGDHVPAQQGQALDVGVQRHHAAHPHCRTTCAA